MKLKNLILTGVAVAITVIATAQEKEKKSPEERATQMTEKMAEAFEIEGEKKDKLEAINLKFVKEIQQVKEDTTIEKEAKKEKMKSIAEKRHEALEDILTADQLKKLKEKEQEKMAKRSEMMEKRKKEKMMTPEQRAKKKTDHLKEELSLTDDQYNKVNDLTVKVIQKIDVIKKDDTMDDARKKEFIKGNKKDFESEMKKILTSEQFEKFQEMKKNHKKGPKPE
ncbi:MAG: hypothetical protein ACO2Z9_08960 [Crocinitomicaceae bacterium]